MSGEWKRITHSQPTKYGGDHGGISAVKECALERVQGKKQMSCSRKGITNRGSALHKERKNLLGLKRKKSRKKEKGENKIHLEASVQKGESDQ